MGRSTDPVAAAKAAMDAAAAAEAAARAAAEAAARAAAEATEAKSETATARTTSFAGAAVAGATDSLGLPTSIGQQAVSDTGALLPGGGALDDSVFADVADRDLSSLGSTGPAAHDSLTSLPGLDGSMLGSRIPGGADALAGAMDRFGLDGGGQDTSATMGKGMIMDDADPWASAVVPLIDSAPATGGSGGSTAPSGGSASTGGSGGAGPAGGSGSTGGTSGSGASGSGGSQGSGDDSTDWSAVWGEVKKGFDQGATWENVEKGWHQSWAGEAVDWVVDAVSDDDDEDASSTATGSGSAASGGAGYQTEDQAGATRAKGWIDSDDLLTQLGRTGTGGVVTGSRGGDPDGGDDGFGGRPGPQGGDTTGNPGSESTYTGVIADRAAPRNSAIDLVGQPDRDPDDEVTLNPDKLQTINTGPGPEEINPGDPQAADSETQASTAYAGDSAMDSAAMDDPISSMPDQSKGWEHSQGHGGGQGHGHAESAADETDIPEEV